MTAEENFMFEDQTKRMDDLRVQLATAESTSKADRESLDLVEKENSELRAVLEYARRGRDTAQGEAAGLRQAIGKVHHWHNTGVKDEGTIISSKSFFALHAAASTRGKSISEWQAEALEEACDGVIFHEYANVKAILRAEAARLRAGSGK